MTTLKAFKGDDGKLRIVIGNKDSIKLYGYAKDFQSATYDILPEPTAQELIDRS